MFMQGSRQRRGLSFWNGPEPLAPGYCGLFLGFVDFGGDLVYDFLKFFRA